MSNRILAFLNWWLAGLLLVLPESVRRRLTPRSDQLTIELEGQTFIFSYYQGGSEVPADSCSFQQDDDQQRSRALQWLSGHQQDDTDLEISILVPDSRVLHKQLDLPVAGEANLQEILGFEMDRQTPFSANQVYFDSLVSRRDHSRQRMLVDLFVSPRENIDPILNQVSAWGLAPGSVCVSRGERIIKHINLLPVDLRPPLHSGLNPATRWWAIAALVLFIVALYGPLLQQQNKLDELEQSVRQSRDLAKQVQPLINERNTILSRTRFLADKQHNQADVLALLEELTRILPDDTSLNRLILQRDEVQLHGESDTGTAVIQLIESSELFHNAQYRSPVTYNNTTNKNKFHVSATIIPAEAS